MRPGYISPCYVSCIRNPFAKLSQTQYNLVILIFEVPKLNLTIAIERSDTEAKKAVEGSSPDATLPAGCASTG